MNFPCSRPIQPHSARYVTLMPTVNENKPHVIILTHIRLPTIILEKRYMYVNVYRIGMDLMQRMMVA